MKAKATHITSRTMISVNMEKFPVKRGNCFSVKTEEGHEYRIVNFSIENLEELNKRGVDFPIHIMVLSERIAIIHDIRIPPNWYDMRWCGVCCPYDLLPLPQQLQEDLAYESGTKIKSEPVKINGLETCIITTKSNELHDEINEPEDKIIREKMKEWTWVASMDEGLVYCPDTPEIKQKDIDKL